MFAGCLGLWCVCCQRCRRRMHFLGKHFICFIFAVLACSERRPVLSILTSCHISWALQQRCAIFCLQRRHPVISIVHTHFSPPCASADAASHTFLVRALGAFVTSAAPHETWWVPPFRTPALPVRGSSTSHRIEHLVCGRCSQTLISAFSHYRCSNGIITRQGQNLRATNLRT